MHRDETNLPGVPHFGRLAPGLCSVETILAWANGHARGQVTDLADLCRRDPPLLLAWLWHDPGECERPPFPSIPVRTGGHCPANRADSLRHFCHRFLLRWSQWRPCLQPDWSSPQLALCLRVWHVAGQAARLLAQQLRANADRAEVIARLATVGHILHGCHLLSRRSLANYHCQLAREPGWPDWLADGLTDFQLPLPATGRVSIAEIEIRVAQCAWQFAQQLLPVSLRVPGPDWHELLCRLGLDPHVLVNLPYREQELPGVQASYSLWPAVYHLVEVLARAQKREHLLQRQAQRWQRQAQVQSERLQGALRDRLLQSLAVFAAGAGHELGNPLAVISGYAEQLLRQEKSLDRIEMIQRILSQCRRVDAVIQDLMFFARPPQPKRTTCRLDTLLAKVAQELAPYAASKGVTMQCHSETSRIIIRADKAMLRTAFDCLLRNAIEAAPSNGWVRCKVSRENSRAVSVHVEDNGSGPHPRWQERIFEPFFSGRDAGRGRGFGLCKVWRIAQLHDGNITWQRTPQNTTVFTLWLPR
ncbi:MAG: HAMP domain-containing sensor histidine kinase [Gemmatales bacterium]|nr:HAMP domain-containing sensor histidine kinase [Gemmatales bacterium]